MSELMYFKEFDTVEEYAEYINNDPVLPNISFVGIEGNVNYNPTKSPEPPHDYSKDYLTIEMLSDGDFTKMYYQFLYYRINNGEWNILDEDEVNIKKGDVIELKSIGNTNLNNILAIRGKYNVYGNIMSLVYEEDFENKNELPIRYGEQVNFYSVFNTAGVVEGVVDASNLILPSEILLEDASYYYGCYEYMFGSCKLLINPPKLPATTLTKACYKNMFYGCSSLIKAPELPATILAEQCYREMFAHCSSLIKAPELPATTLANECYREMFAYCSSLIKVPELPATILNNYCYYNMFGYCSSLKEVTCLATDISAEYCTVSWLYGVSPIGTFIKHPDMNDWSIDINGIPDGWTVENAVL